MYNFEILVSLMKSEMKIPTITPVNVLSLAFVPAHCSSLKNCRETVYQIVLQIYECFVDFIFYQSCEAKMSSNQFDDVDFFFLF